MKVAITSMPPINNFRRGLYIAENNQGSLQCTDIRMMYHSPYLVEERIWLSLFSIRLGQTCVGFESKEEQ